MKLKAVIGMVNGQAWDKASNQSLHRFFLTFGLPTHIN
jgi:hypothetical protein